MLGSAGSFGVRQFPVRIYLIEEPLHERCASRCGVFGRIDLRVQCVSLLVGREESSRRARVWALGGYLRNRSCPKGAVVS